MAFDIARTVTRQAISLSDGMEKTMYFIRDKNHRSNQTASFARIIVRYCLLILFLISENLE